MNNKKKGLLYISVTIFCWGVLSIAIKSVSEHVNAYNIAWFRFSFAAISLTIFHSIRRPEYLSIFKNPPLLAIVAALCLGGNYLGYNKGVEITSPSIAQIIIQLGPLALAMSGIFLFKEKLNRLQIIGFIVATSGFLLFYGDQLTQFINTSALNTGVLWIIFGALTWTLYAILQKKLVSRFEPSQLNLLIFSIPAIAFIALADFNQFLLLEINQWLLLIFLGANTLIAYGCLAEAFKYLPANNISILITLNPLITLACVEIIHQLGLKWIPYTPISGLGYLGAILVITGAVTIVWMQSKTLPKVKSSC